MFIAKDEGTETDSAYAHTFFCFVMFDSHLVLVIDYLTKKMGK